MCYRGDRQRRLWSQRLRGEYGASKASGEGTRRSLARSHQLLFLSGFLRGLLLRWHLSCTPFRVPRVPSSRRRVSPNPGPYHRAARQLVDESPPWLFARVHATNLRQYAIQRELFHTVRALDSHTLMRIRDAGAPDGRRSVRIAIACAVDSGYSNRVLGVGTRV
jgi:hypothetical protein